MREIAIGHKGTLLLRIDQGERNPDGTSDYLMITAKLDGLRAVKRVYDFDRWSRLLSFFEELEADWRGWDGHRRFDSLEGDFRLAAQHDGHIRFFVELDAFELLEPWSAKGEFVLDPGEELAATVEALRALLAVR
ncbi:DUF6228 family protein [Pseudarthrobacter sp. NamE5]|uniref:DUF6228 family protein n=1 Tax=Pseudarthrobacter sp. NamE5 TaxID=2576839 RepID=UPI00110AFD3C|nr:DUF6228 family protein [Pseudarthrobacter sp. NamE5]TLM80806.1 hypothetical protein FDW84_18310 [Pseudarthrobacter sp. NamE5]